jgi:HD-like signal output (HDOD) protein/CheY-like chemotaxis protein
MSTTHILFVDDEVRILEGLRRSMHCMRDEWHMRFAGSGAAALKALAAEPADVVVSDMRMPEMDGSELLSEVMRLYPSVVRIILSGEAEPASIVRATRSAHQYLSKPCEASAIKAAISRTIALRSILCSDALAAIVGSVDTLPSPPRAYQELLTCLRDSDADIRVVTDIIRRDVAMTAKIVKVANSGFFGLRAPVHTVERAVALVGVDAVTTLVLGQELFITDQPITDPGFSLENLSRHSFECAAWGRAVALHEGLPVNLADAAFLAGVVHDLGKLIFATRAAPTGPQAQAMWISEAAPEREAHHAAVGGYLLGLWAFPDPIVEAIVWHHTPSHCGQTELGLCGLVHIGDQLAHERDRDRSGPHPTALEPGYLDALGLADRWPHWQSIRPGPVPEAVNAR